MQDVSLSNILITEEQRFLAEPDDIERFVSFHAQRGVLPPLQLSRDYHLLSGVECFCAAESLGLTQVTAIVEPRTPQEKRKDVLALLGDPKWCQESSKALARYTYTRREMVVNIRAHYADPTAERTVQRGAQTYTIQPSAPRSVPTHLYDERFYAPQMTPDFADVILSAAPPVSEVPLADCARAMASALNEDGAVYLLFTSDQLGDLSTWRPALEAAGLPYGGLLCWQVKRCTPGLPGFELILVMGRLPSSLSDNQVLTGPRAQDALDSATLYRKPAWLSTRLLKAHQGQAVLDPFVRSSFALRGAQRAGVRSASGYLLTSEYREEAAPFVPQK